VKWFRKEHPYFPRFDISMAKKERISSEQVQNLRAFLNENEENLTMWQRNFVELIIEEEELNINQLGILKRMMNK
jgi:spore cortex formation protein SpoVR/YcgB (stage V sporulation)